MIKNSHPEREDWGMCATEGCTRFVAIKKLALCNSCYRRDSYARGKAAGLDLSRAGMDFWAKVDAGAAEDCWPWTGAPHKEGHGTYWQSNVSYHAHTVAYRLVHGEIPEGKLIDHKCRNRICVNPNHLQAVTHKQNMENTAARKNTPSGYRGVTYRKDSGLWRARVGHNKKVITVGHFTTAEEAYEAVVNARLELHTNNLDDRR